MCKEMLVKLVNRVVDKKKNNRKKWRAEEEERHKGSLTQKNRNFLCLMGSAQAVPSAIESHGLVGSLRVEEGEAVFLERRNGHLLPPLVGGVHGAAEIHVPHGAATPVPQGSGANLIKYFRPVFVYGQNCVNYKFLTF
jgi:hypothetical protein